jgi:hypothetical protein
VYDEESERSGRNVRDMDVIVDDGLLWYTASHVSRETLLRILPE